MKIGDVARQTGTNVPTIRYYEKIGLLGRAARNGGGQRVYGAAEVMQLSFIKRCRDFDFPIDEIKKVMGALGGKRRSAVAAREIAARQLRSLQSRQAALKQLTRNLSAVIEQCEALCRPDANSGCALCVDFGPPLADGAKHLAQK